MPTKANQVSGPTIGSIEKLVLCMMTRAQWPLHMSMYIDMMCYDDVVCYDDVICYDLTMLWWCDVLWSYDTLWFRSSILWWHDMMISHVTMICMYEMLCCIMIWHAMTWMITKSFFDVQTLSNIMYDQCTKTYVCMLPKVIWEECVRLCYMND